MTLNEFLGEFVLVAKNYKWFLGSKLEIRGKKKIGRKEATVCPLTAHYQVCYNTDIRDVTYEVMKAADCLEGYDKELRLKLLKVCGI